MTSMTVSSEVTIRTHPGSVMAIAGDDRRRNSTSEPAEEKAHVSLFFSLSFLALGESVTRKRPGTLAPDKSISQKQATFVFSFSRGRGM